MHGGPSLVRASLLHCSFISYFSEDGENFFKRLLGFFRDVKLVYFATSRYCFWSSLDLETMAAMDAVSISEK